MASDALRRKIEEQFRERRWHNHGQYWNFGKCSEACEAGRTYADDGAAHIWAYLEENEHGVLFVVVNIGDDAAEIHPESMSALLPLFESLA